jgi:hypothetical protein
VASVAGGRALDRSSDNRATVDQTALITGPVGFFPLDHRRPQRARIDDRLET